MKHRFFLLALFVLYIAFVTAMMNGRGLGFILSRYAFLLIFGSLLVKKTRQFIFDWLPFLLIAVSYDFMRDIAVNLSYQAHYFEPMVFDQKLFGIVPSAWMQQMFFRPTDLAWYDYAMTIFYFFHLVLPLGFGFILWNYQKQAFREFWTGLSLFSYAAFFTHLIHPVVPPWLAAQDGYLSGVTKVMSVTLANLSQQINLVDVLYNLNPNPIGSLPSSHTGYSFLVLLFALRYFRWKALPFFLYVIAVWVTIIYLGEHYVIDIVWGIAYAVLAYLLSKEILHAFDWPKILQRVKREKSF